MLKMELLEDYGIDTEEGLACCAEDPEFYEEMIHEFLKESIDRCLNLEKCFFSQDWSGYALCTHSIKSTSRMIGAKDLSEAARELETAAKEGFADTIYESHELFLENYRTLTDELRKITAD